MSVIIKLLSCLHWYAFKSFRPFLYHAKTTCFFWSSTWERSGNFFLASSLLISFMNERILFSTCLYPSKSTFGVFSSVLLVISYIFFIVFGFFMLFSFNVPVQYSITSSFMLSGPLLKPSCLIHSSDSSG